MKRIALVFCLIGMFFACQDSNRKSKETQDATLEFTDYYNRDANFNNNTGI